MNFWMNFYPGNMLGRFPLYFFCCCCVTVKTIFRVIINVLLIRNVLFPGREKFVEYWQLLIWWFEGGAISIKWNRILFSIFERAARCLFLSDFNWGRCSFEYTVCIVFDGFITFVVNLYSIWGHYYTCGQLSHLWLQHRFLIHVIFPIAVLLRASAILDLASGHQSAFWSMAHLGSCELYNFFFFYYGTHRPYSLLFLFYLIFFVLWLRKNNKRKEIKINT